MSEATLPAGDGEAWLSSLQAVKKFRDAGGTDPIALAHWAEQRSLRARAGNCRIEGEYTEFVGWPDIPHDFWRWIYTKGEQGQHGEPYAQWDAGVFATMVYYDPQNGLQYSDRDHWRLSRVTFNAKDLERLLTETEQARTSSDQPIYLVANSRGAGRKPNKSRWESTAAAMAVLAAKGTFNPKDRSDNAWHGQLDSFLQKHGYGDGFEIDNLRGLFKLYCEWSANGPHDSNAGD